MKRRGWLLLVLLACAGPVLAAPSVSVTPLTAAEVPALLQPPAHGERILMLWGLACRYCEPNMRELASLQRAHPDQIELVTVATDNVVHSAAVASRLAAAGMQAYPARIYAEPTPTRLNFLIDPAWGGEMPRTLVIRADGSRVAISGELTPTQLHKITP